MISIKTISGDVDEEIVTLPETPTNPTKPSSPFKRHRSEDANGTSVKKAAFAKETTLLSSGESSPDPDSPENRKLKNGGGPGTGGKIPPKTYPKPEWYLKARKNSMSPPPLLSPERVKVVVSSLPSPQKVTATTVTSHEIFHVSPTATTATSVPRLVDTSRDDDDDDDLVRMACCWLVMCLLVLVQPQISSLTKLILSFEYSS